MAVAVVVVAYAIGCLTAGYYLVRRMAGADLRSTGSGSTGARNVSRLLGMRAAVLTFAFDLTKGAGAVAIARAVAGSPRVQGAALVAVVAGHVFPAQLDFRGGRGLATALGGLLLLDWRLGAIGLAVAAVCLAVSRAATASGLVGTAAAPIGGVVLGASRAAVGAALLAMLVIFAAHRRQRPAAGPQLQG